MENSNAHRPVPATDEIMNKLPREVLTVNCMFHGFLADSNRLSSGPAVTLREDCAVCKDQFKLETEDPAEQIVIKLPCKHQFHEPCIELYKERNSYCLEISPITDSPSGRGFDGFKAASMLISASARVPASSRESVYSSNTKNRFMRSQADLYCSWPLLQYYGTYKTHKRLTFILGRVRKASKQTCQQEMSLL